MSRRQLIEKLEANLKRARERNTEWLPLPVEDAESILVALGMFCWGVGEGDTMLVSRKGGVDMAAGVMGGEVRASIIGPYFDKVALPEALAEVLDDLAAAVEAMIAQVVRIADDA